MLTGSDTLSLQYYEQNLLFHSPFYDVLRVLYASGLIVCQARDVVGNTQSAGGNTSLIRLYVKTAQ